MAGLWRAQVQPSAPARVRHFCLCNPVRPMNGLLFKPSVLWGYARAELTVLHEEYSFPLRYEHLARVER